MTRTKNASIDGAAPTAKKTVRVAIYARQSVLRGDDGDFGSIESQRESVEAYVQSQRAQGWTITPERYDDGGYSGATTERPALKRLLEDVVAGRIDVIAAYKYDRLSRSLLDFSRLLAFLGEHDVSFVSTTQAFDTSTPAGKLMVNMLMSFAEFERETIAERTRDKMLATRKRGKWTGGPVPLGFDVIVKHLVVNADEAERVRAIFSIYRRLGSLTGTLAELRHLGWTHKQRETPTGARPGGRPFTSMALRRFLANPLYVGRIRAGDEVVDAEHEAIVDPELWDAVQAKLATKQSSGGRTRTSWTSLLGGLVSCGRCGSAMTHTTTRQRERVYRSYVCVRMHKEGAAACPGARVPAAAFEDVVMNRLRNMGHDHALVAEIESALATGNAQGDSVDRVRDTLASFDDVWSALFAPERNRIARLLLEHVVYDPEAKSVQMKFRPTGIRALLDECGPNTERR